MKISLFPTLKNYKKEYFGKDLTAGIMIAAVSIPISMGYAEVSGLPAVFGLYGSVLPILFFALFSTSPQFIFGVDAAPVVHRRSSVVQVLELRVGVWMHSGIFQLLHYSLVYGCFCFIF